jgi:hypothetical protein
VTRSLVVLLGAAVIALTSATAPADVSKDQCVDLNSSAQKLRAAGSFSAARDALRTCGDPTCPRMVRDDCVRRTDELDRAQPTIVFDVKDDAGNDLGAVHVTIDGKPLADKLTGTALRVDPGQHTFGFAVEGKTPVTRSFLVKEGEKDRRERIVMISAQAAPSPAPDAEAPAGAAPEPAAPWSTRKIVGLVVGGVGVAGLVTGGVFGLLAASANSAQKSACASPTSCNNPSGAESDHSTLETDGTVSTVAFIAGGVLVAAGAVIFFTAANASPPAASGLVVEPTFGRSGGGLSVRAAF